MAKILIKKEDGKGLIGCYDGSKEDLKNMLSELLTSDNDFFAIKLHITRVFKQDQNQVSYVTRKYLNAGFS